MNILTKIRPITKSDLPQIMIIEESAHIAPWTEETFGICFQAGYLGWAMELDKKLIAFVMISINGDECHILNVCVDRIYQHQGLGRELMNYAIQQALESGARYAYLEVRRSNTRAITLYRKMQFHLVGERKDYYPSMEGLEDALVFAKSLIERK